MQKIQHEVGCTCTSKSCHHLYLELPHKHCWSESDLKISVDEWWPSMVAEDEEVESLHKTIGRSCAELPKEKYSYLE